jgi:2-phosphosulfolactate phosphatase
VRHYEVVTDDDRQGQSAFNRHFGWGPTAAALMSEGTTIIVDVLRFTSAVEAATSRGAVVFPYRWADDGAQDFANSVGAALANSSQPDGLSLSPISLLVLESQDRIVLPSPNGATCALLAAHAGSTVIAGCLRNADAVGRAFFDHGESITVIACGERWPDATLRPALEDLLGAGAVLSKLGGRPSPDARSAIAAWRDAQHRVDETMKTCSSGVELQRKGASDDVVYCSQVNVSEVVPVLFDGAFRCARPEQLLRDTIIQ